MLLEVLVTERAGDRARGEGSGREAVLAALGEFFERARCGDLRSHKTHKKRNERVQHLSTGSRPQHVKLWHESKLKLTVQFSAKACLGLECQDPASR